MLQSGQVEKYIYKVHVLQLPGGGPQGTRLGLFLFLILVNFAGYQDLEKKLGEHITVTKTKRQIIPKIHLKFVDDLTLATAFNIKDYVIPNPDPNPPRTLSYHDRTLHVVPRDRAPLQAELRNMVKYCEDNNMKINGDKTKAVLFNTSRNYDFTPQLALTDNTTLELVEEFRLLGLVIQSNMGWQANTNNICKKAYSRIWMLRRLRNLGASQADMLDVYNKQIRCVLEFCVAVWTPGLTKAEAYQIERVQKCALHVIMGANFIDYENSLSILKTEKLSERRSNLCLKFIKQCEKSPKYSNWFKLSEQRKHPNVKTRNQKNNQSKYEPVPFRTERYGRSPLPFLTTMLNEYHASKK